jgi:hypothetical protein
MQLHYYFIATECNVVNFQELFQNADEGQRPYLWGQPPFGYSHLWALSLLWSWAESNRRPNK